MMHLKSRIWVNSNSFWDLKLLIPNLASPYVKENIVLTYCEDSGLLGFKPVSTPSDPSIKLHNYSTPPFLDIPAYRRLIGRLLYLNTTRPDITYITQQLSQFLSHPSQTHHTAAMRVLRHLKCCPDRGLFFSRHSSLQIKGYTYAD